MEETENPFLTTPIDVMQELIVNLSHNFLQSTKADGTVEKDYTAHIELHATMINYIWNNRDTEFIRKAMNKTRNGRPVDALGILLMESIVEKEKKYLNN